MRGVVLVLALLAGGCNFTWRDQWATDSRQAAFLIAQTRRVQLLREIELLERLHRRTLAIDTSTLIQSSINRKRFEVEQLNAVIEVER